MRQQSFVYRPAYTGSEAWRGVDPKDKPGGLLELLKLAADHLGRMEVTFECDVGKTTLSEAINESNDKRWAGEWICKVLAMLAKRGDDESKRLGGEILAALVGLMPCFALVDADEGMTDAELEAMERAVAREKSKRRKRAA
jgi:hypothetical protein